MKEQRDRRSWLDEQDALVSVLTGLGDDELILGHRHSEWTGYAPHIEEDIAFSSIAQDEIGHASAYYSLAVRGHRRRTRSTLPSVASRTRTRNALLVERQNHDWAYTLARHWIYDHADALRLETLEGTSYDKLAALVRKIRREERYHLIHADMWMKRIARGPVEGRSKLVDACRRGLRRSRRPVRAIREEEHAVNDGIVPVASDELREQFARRIATALDELGLPTHHMDDSEQGAEFVASSSGDLIEREGSPEADARGRRMERSGGRSGHHSPDFKSLWDVMTSHVPQ